MRKIKTKIREAKTVQIGAIPFQLRYSADARTVAPDDGGTQRLFGCEGTAEGYIALLLTQQRGRMGSVFFHELIHGIVDTYGIINMQDEEGKHVEDNIDRMAIGLYLAMKSMGIHIEDFLRDPKENNGKRKTSGR